MIDRKENKRYYIGTYQDEEFTKVMSWMRRKNSMTQVQAIVENEL